MLWKAMLNDHNPILSVLRHSYITNIEIMG